MIELLFVLVVILILFGAFAIRVRRGQKGKKSSSPQWETGIITSHLIVSIAEKGESGADLFVDVSGHNGPCRVIIPLCMKGEIRGIDKGDKVEFERRPLPGVSYPHGGTLKRRFS